MVYYEGDLIQAINEALFSAREAVEIAAALQDAADDPTDRAKLNLIKERAQLIVDFLEDVVVTDYLADLDARDPVVDNYKAERSRLLERLKDDLDPRRPGYIGFFHKTV